MNAVDEVVVLFAERGGEHHGEVVDQRDHALQCASLARADGAADHLVAAALLHDIGHLVGPAAGVRREDPATADDRHEAIGARWVASRFGPAVARPIALHVLAKRYRCTVDHDGIDSLSPASTLSLRVQGGLLDDAAVARFRSDPAHAEALTLRSWDEAAKDPGRITDGVEAFLPVLGRMASAPGRTPG